MDWRWALSFWEQDIILSRSVGFSRFICMRKSTDLVQRMTEEPVLSLSPFCVSFLCSLGLVVALHSRRLLNLVSMSETC